MPHIAQRDIRLNPNNRITIRRLERSKLPASSACIALHVATTEPSRMRAGVAGQATHRRPQSRPARTGTDEQIDELQKTAIQELNWNTVNDLTKLKEHQEFMYKLLTNKDSFIRKKLIDQNLNYLNSRLR